MPARGTQPGAVPVQLADVLARTRHWSTDGKRLLYVGENGDDTAGDAWIIVADKSGPTHLTQSGDVGFATWSPDGAEIAVLETRASRQPELHSCWPMVPSRPVKALRSGVPAGPAWARR